MTRSEDHSDGNAEIRVGFRSGEVGITGEREDGVKVEAVLTPDSADELAQMIIEAAADARADVGTDEGSGPE